MAEPILQGPRIVPRICQCVAAGVAEHVAMDVVLKARALTDAFYKPVDGVRGKGFSAFGPRSAAPPQPVRPTAVVAPNRFEF